MDGEIDLRTADRDVLIGIIIRQQTMIDQLEKRVAQLEGRAKSSGSGRMPGLKPKGDRKPSQSRKPRKRRPHGFARARMTPASGWSTRWIGAPTAEPVWLVVGCSALGR